MSHRILSTACFALIALAAALTNAAPASAAEYGSFVLHNTSNVPINYRISWTDGDVEVYTIAPGVERAHYVALDENGEIPGPTITFDCKGGDNAETMLSYDLDAFAVSDPQRGKDYSFVYSDDGVFLDLYEG
ncbi:MAG TPA: hypothetical protein VEQ85_09990 [Lacipirellulaceae bacterium]|nr:hypothetical protein [Lacipirellulaceae bacterium]